MELRIKFPIYKQSFMVIGKYGNNTAFNVFDAVIGCPATVNMHSYSNDKCHVMVVNEADGCPTFTI